MFGFGGCPTPGPANHCFPMYDSSGSHYCDGIGGILQAYGNTLNTVSLSGPTYFAPLINNAAQIAAATPVTQANQKYYILLIITDGAACTPSELCCMRWTSSCAAGVLDALFWQLAPAVVTVLAVLGG